MNRREFLRWSGLGLLGAAGFAHGCNCGGGPRNGADFDVVIVGGGISGLTAGYLLRDRQVLVLEQQEAAGGRIIHGEWEGFRYPKGMEYIGPPEGELLQWLSELGVSAVTVPAPTGAVGNEGRVYSGAKVLDFLKTDAARADYQRLGNALTALNESGIEDALFEDLEDLSDFKTLDAMSVGDWLRQEGYHPLVQTLVDVENRGLFGASNNDLSLALNVPEMAWNLYDPDEAEESEVYTFPGGMDELAEALEKKLGSAVRRGAEATNVSIDAGHVLVDFVAGGTTSRVTANTAILATPAPIALDLAADSIPASVRTNLGKVRYSSYVTMNLMLSSRLWREAWSLACLDGAFVTLYDSLRTQVSASYVDKGVLGVYVAPRSAADSSMLQLDDDALLARMGPDLERYVPGVLDAVTGVDVHRFLHGFPVFEPGYATTLAQLHAAQSGPVLLAGDYMGYPTFEGAVVSAVRAEQRARRYL